MFLHFQDACVRALFRFPGTEIDEHQSIVHSVEFPEHDDTLPPKPKPMNLLSLVSFTTTG